MKKQTLKKDWENSPAVKKFKKLYLEECVSVNEVSKKLNLSPPHIKFLAEELGVKLSVKQRGLQRKKKRFEYYETQKPLKSVLEHYYEEVNFSLYKMKVKFFPKITYLAVRKWFDDYKIPRRFAIRYKTKDERIANILECIQKRIK